MSEPKRDNRNRRARRNSRDKARGRGEKVRGRESKEGPTCQRERKVDAPEERERSSFVSFGDTVQPALVPVRFRPPSRPTTSGETFFSPIKVPLPRRDSQKRAIRRFNAVSLTILLRDTSITGTRRHGLSSRRLRFANLQRRIYLFPQHYRSSKLVEGNLRPLDENTCRDRETQGNMLPTSI